MTSTIDILIALIGAVVLIIGCWLARTPFDYFVTGILTMVVVLAVSTLLATANEIKAVKVVLDKIQSTFGHLIQ